MSYLVKIKKVGETDDQLEPPRSLASRIQQTCMGIIHGKNRGEAMDSQVVPMEVIIQRHPEDKKSIQHFMKRWHEKMAFTVAERRIL